MMDGGKSKRSEGGPGPQLGQSPLPRFELYLYEALGFALRARVQATCLTYERKRP